MEDEIKYSDEIEKVVNQQNTDCALFGTEQCMFLNMGLCGDCPVGNLKKDKQERAGEALKRLMNAAPEEELKPLYTSENCLLSRGEEKADCYAMFDLRKPDPEGNWTVALGKKKLEVKDADMILPVTVSCSKKCRSAYNAFEYLPGLAAIAVCVIGLVVITLRSVYDALFAVGSFVPALAMLLVVGIAFCLRCLLKMGLARSMRRKMTVDVSEIQEIKKLMDGGFSEVYDKKYGVSRMVFSEKRREHGVYSRS